MWSILSIALDEVSVSVVSNTSSIVSGSVGSNQSKLKVSGIVVSIAVFIQSAGTGP